MLGGGGTPSGWLSRSPREEPPVVPMKATNDTKNKLLSPFFLIPNPMSPQILQLANGVVLTVQLQVLEQTFCL